MQVKKQMNHHFRSTLNKWICFLPTLLIFLCTKQIWVSLLALFFNQRKEYITRISFLVFFFLRYTLTIGHLTQCFFDFFFICFLAFIPVLQSVSIHNVCTHRYLHCLLSPVYYYLFACLHGVCHIQPNSRSRTSDLQTVCTKTFTNILQESETSYIIIPL